MDALRLDQASLLFKFGFPPGQFGFYGSDGGGASLFFHHIVRLRINRQPHVTLFDRPKQGIDLRERFEHVAKHYDAIRIVVVGRLNYDDIDASTRSLATIHALAPHVETY